MKKQLLAAAIAAVIATPAMADISITGNANFEYFYDESSVGTSDNVTDTEININVRGQSGDTTVVLDLEFTGHGDVDAANGDDSPLDIENSYITTKVGPVDVKAGNYASSTSALLGEIENGPRANNKLTLSYDMDGIKVYAGNSGTEQSGNNRESTVKPSMFAGVVTTVEGWKLQVKKNNSDKNSFGVAGKVGPVSVRAEMADSDVDKDNGYFLGLETDLSGITLNYSMVEMDADNGITEDDSSIFYESNDGRGNSNSQLMAATTVNGTTYSAKLGSIGYEAADNDDIDYWEIAASRTLASGVTVKVDYGEKDNGTADMSQFEIDLSVKF